MVALPQVCEAWQEIPQPSSLSCSIAAFLIVMAILIAEIHFPEKKDRTGCTVAAPLGVARPFRAVDFYYNYLMSVSNALLLPHPHVQRRAVE